MSTPAELSKAVSRLRSVCMQYGEARHAGLNKIENDDVKLAATLVVLTSAYLEGACVVAAAILEGALHVTDKLDR